MFSVTDNLQSKAAAALPTKSDISAEIPPLRHNPANDKNASPAPILSNTFVERIGALYNFFPLVSRRIAPLLPKVTAKKLALVSAASFSRGSLWLWVAILNSGPFREIKLARG